MTDRAAAPFAPWQAYLFAAGSSLAALAARVAFDGQFRGLPGLLVFTVPILLSAYAGGVRGGLMATLVCFIASQILIWLPLRPTLFDAASHRWLQFFLLVAGIVISVASEGLHRARIRAVEAARRQQGDQARLRREGALLMNAQRLAGLGVWEADVRANKLTWSAETCRIFGVRPEDFGGTREALFALIHPADVERVRATVGHGQVAGTSADAQYRIVRPDGAVRVVSQQGEITLDDMGMPLRRFGVIMDVTERENALRDHRELAAQLQLEKGRLLAAQAVARMGSWETDLATGAVAWSDETHRIFGTDPATFFPTHAEFLARVHPEDVAKVDDAFNRSLDVAGPHAIEHRVLMRDGRVKTVEERWETAFDAGAKAVRVLGTCQDISERIEAARVLEALSRTTLQRERVLSTLLATMSDLAYILDRDARFVFANQALLRLWGMTLAEVVGRGFLELGYPPQLAERLEEQLDLVFDRGLPLTDETAYTSPAGIDGFYEYIFSPVISADGVVELVVGSTRDVTARKRAEEDMRREHSLLASALRVGGMGVWEFDAPSDRVTWSDETYRIFGIAPDAFAHTSAAFYALVHADDVDRMRALQAAAGQKGAAEGEFRIRRGDGAERVLFQRGESTFDPAGGLLRTLGVVVDVTERHRAERSLQLQKTELRVLFDLMPAMVWFKDSEGRIVRVNQRVATTLGRPIGEIEGRPWVEVYPGEAASFREADLEIIRTGRPQLATVEQVRDATGAQAWVQTDKVPYFDEEGRVVGIVVMAQDVTERMNAEARLRKSHNELIAVSRLGGMAEVASDVLHNVGSVLNSINVSASLVVDNVKSSRASRMADVVKLLREHRGDLGDYITSHPTGQRIPEVLETLSKDWVAQQELLVRELGDLRGNVDHIKRIVALQQGHVGGAEVVESIAVAQLVEEAVNVQQGALTFAHVALVREFESLEPVQVSRHKAVQILVSLLRNARQACRDVAGGEPCITLRIVRRGGNAAISVSDNGVGIARDNLVRIFAPGFTTRLDARGYGLHSAALAAGEMGGSLAAHSAGPGTGSTFTLELPMRQAEAA